MAPVEPSDGSLPRAAALVTEAIPGSRPNSMPTSTDPAALAVPNLEQVGALASRLVHDLANHLCIISGNATFAELIPNDRPRVEDAIRSIVQASEQAGRLLSRCSELREKLLEGTPPGTAAELIEALVGLYGPNASWRLSISPDLKGRVPLPSRWVALVSTHQGIIVRSRNEPETGTRPKPEGRVDGESRPATT